MSRYSRKVSAFFAVITLVAGLLSVAASPAGAVSTELLLTQYVEGSSFNKAIEISNLTAGSADLSAYTLELYSNGSPTVSQSVALAGTLTSGDVYVVSHASANAAIQAVSDLTSSAVANWNGDDAIVLRKNGTIVDVFGQVGVDPGTEWGAGTTTETQNNTLCRNAVIEDGDTNPSDAFDPSLEWTGLGNDVLDGLGVVGCAAAPTGSVLFTQYVEGSGFNKAIEIANLSGSSVDLSTYTLELYSNGNPGPATSTQSLSGTLADGEVIVLANANANAAILAVADSTSGSVNWNGDDAIVLRNGTDVVDAFGQVGFDPGAAWGAGTFSTVNNTLCRNDDVRFGDTIATDVFDPSVEWNGLGVDVINGLGEIGCDAPPPPAAVVQIHEIQGTGSSVAITTPVEVTAIVTSLFTAFDVLDGFFIQEPDLEVDGSNSTSEGIFVFCRGNCPTTLAVGDEVTVTGTPEEFFGMSQIDTEFGSTVVMSSGNPLPSPTSIDLPASGSTLAEETFETIEGMIVSFADTLVVSEYFELARYGQVVLTESARPYQFTDESTPSVAGYAAFLDDLAARRIILDDDNNAQNDPVVGTSDEAYFYPNPGLSTTNRFRGGDTISNLTGVMHWSFAGQSGTDAWRIRPIAGVDYSFTPANPAPASPDDVGGSMTVASFNVLNYFTTLDVRGADSIAELDRQRAKIVAAIVDMDADVVGIIEVENDAGAATADLVAGLNVVAGAGTYDFIDTGVIGTDQIKVGFIYQPEKVTPVGDFAILDSSVDPTFIDTKNRPALIQTFEQNSTGERVTVAVNHLKSKGSSCSDVGDPEPNDGQASCALTRTNAAIALANYLDTDPTASGDPDFLIIGDLNSYAMEDPIVALINAGYTDLLDSFVGDDAYGYLFDGQLGYLDYALANSALLGQVTGTTAWHINADEIPLFDYNDDIQDAGEASFERESGVLELFAPDALRSSDHDPVLVGLNLDSIPENPTCNGLAATIVGTAGDDVIVGTNKADVIVTFGGDDTISGGNGNDVICSGFGNDVIDAGNGTDYVDAGSGDDVVDGGRGDDTISAGDGDDVIMGGRGDDSLDGGPDVDEIDGGQGVDTCIVGESVFACEL